MGTTDSVNERSPRDRLLESCDGHTLHHGRLATNTLLREIAGTERVTDVPKERITDVIEAIKQRRNAVQEAKRAARAARFGN